MHKSQQALQNPQDSGQYLLLSSAPMGPALLTQRQDRSEHQAGLVAAHLHDLSRSSQTWRAGADTCPKPCLWFPGLCTCPKAMSFLDAQSTLHLMILPLHEGSGLFTNQTEAWDYSSASLLNMQEAGFDPQCCIKPDKVTYTCDPNTQEVGQ